MIYICCVALRRTAINARVNVCWKQQLATWMTEHREEDRHGRRSACMRSIFWLATIQIIWRNYTQTLNQAYIRIICELILLFLFQMCSKKTNGKHGEIIHDVIQYTIVYTFRWFVVTLVGSSDLVASKPFIYNSIRWKLHRMQSSGSFVKRALIRKRKTESVKAYFFRRDRGCVSPIWVEEDQSIYLRHIWFYKATTLLVTYL